MKNRYSDFTIYYKSMKLQTKLIILFLTFTIIPFSILGVLSYGKFSTIIISEVLKNSSQIVEQVADKIDYNMKELDRNTLLFLWNSRTQDILNSHFSTETLYKRKLDQMELENGIQTFLNTRLEIESVYIYRNDGDEFYIDNSVYDEEVRKRIIINRTLLTTEAEKLEGENKWITLSIDKGLITSTRIIYDTINLKKLGLLVMNVQEKYINSLYDNVNLSTNSFFIVRSANGDIISTNSKLEGEDLAELFKNTAVKQLGQYDVLTSYIENNQYLIVKDTSSFARWELYGIIPRNELLGEITKIGLNIMFICATCIVISITMIILFSSQILKPVKRLTKLMKKVEQEDFEVKAEINSMDELGELNQVFNRMMQKIRYLIEEVYKQQIIKKETEFKFLQAQINPHFLYNTLDSINWIAKMNGIEDISTMVVALGQLMQISIGKGKGILTLEKELEYTRSYLTIQSMRYRDKFSLTMKIEDNTLNCIVPKMILQPIVENALIHGIERKLGKGKIEISSQIFNNLLLIIVHDDGLGMDKKTSESILYVGKEALEEDKPDKNAYGIGVSNVNQRIQMIYGNNFGVQIESELGIGTKVIICLPVEYKEKEILA